MKRIYFRPPGISRGALLLIAGLAMVAHVTVQAFPRARQQSFYAEKLSAARRAREAMAIIKEERVRRGIPIDKVTDPSESGLIGSPLTPVTSNTGYLDAKQASVNPNFAAVIVGMLKRANLERGDTVAVGLSGSFPALNICTYAALQTLGLTPIVITSAAASEWGANEPSFMWLDMERVLHEKHVFAFRSTAASLGGIDDRGFGMSKEGRDMLRVAIERSGVTRVDSKSVEDAIEQRMQIYEETAGDRTIRAYVNIGGGSASVGTHLGKKQFRPGINTEIPQAEILMDSVMMRFLSRDIPVIHVSQIKELAKKNGLPARPETLPRVGEGSVYVRAEYNRWLAAAFVIAILGALVAFIRLDVGMRLLPGQKAGERVEPEEMI